MSPVYLIACLDSFGFLLPKSFKRNLYFFVDELPAVDLLVSGSSDAVFSQLISDEDGICVDMYQAVSLPVIIERHITSPIRAQLVSAVLRLRCI